MREGAWLSSGDRRWAWVDDHAAWILRPRNAQAMGVPADVQEHLLVIPSPRTPVGRREVLLTTMGAGFIRVRGHGATTTFEAKLPIITVLESVLPFLRRHLGPWMTCRFNRLDTGESWCERVGVILPCEGAPTVVPCHWGYSEPLFDGRPGGEA